MKDFVIRTTDSYTVVAAPTIIQAIVIFKKISDDIILGVIDIKAYNQEAQIQDLIATIGLS